MGNYTDEKLEELLNDFWQDAALHESGEASLSDVRETKQAILDHIKENYRRVK